MALDDSRKTRQFRIVGTRPDRPDGIDKVTGRARFGADMVAPGMLTGRILRSPHAHARIRRIDTSKAEALSGVKAVVTRADFGDVPDHVADIMENCLAGEKALYDGHAVAAVAAISPAVARQALRLIEVDYEVLPHVTDVDEAMKPDAPVLHEGRQQETVPAGMSGNVISRVEFGHGDIEAGLAKADRVVERTYRTAAVHQGYIEPHACLATMTADGQGDLWVCTQGHYMVRNTCAAILGLDQGQLRVTASEIGGGFGGKTTLFLEPVALMLSKKSGRPIKMVMSRSEVFRASGPTASSSIDVRIGMTREGRITAGFAELRFQGGAWPGAPVGVGAMSGFASYDLENVKTVGWDVVTNRPKAAAYRAPGAPMATFAIESAIDELARGFGLDPLEVRLMNGADEGTKSSYGPTYPAIGLKATLEAAKAHPHWTAPLGKNQGRGVACGFWFNFGGDTSVSLSISPDGTVTLTEGNPDIGGSRAAMTMIAAEELGIPYDQVRTVVADTGSLGQNEVTDGWSGDDQGGRGGKERDVPPGRDGLGHRRRRRGMGGWRSASGRPQCGEISAHDPKGNRGNRLEDRRADRRASRGDGRGGGGKFCHPYGRCRGRSRDRGHEDPALYGVSGCRQGGASLLCRGAVSGRRGAGHRLGAQ
jgi:CO/xanthine dehydrogenase Mo-binding subunit